MANNPPPYFPQQFSTKDSNRYKKFKLVVFGIATILTLIAAGVIAGIIYLIKWVI